MTLRRTQLKRGKKRIPHSNPKRKLHLFERNFGEKGDWIRSKKCWFCGWLVTMAAHTRSRGAGGTKADLIPMCFACHGIQHHHGWSRMLEFRDDDPKAEARRLEAGWQARLDSAPCP